MDKPYNQFTKVELLPGEKIWSGAIKEAYRMPFKSGYSFDFYANNLYSQLQPLILSDKGLYVWSEEPFSFAVEDNELVLNGFQGKLETGREGSTFKEVRDYVAGKYFPPSGTMPDPDGFGDLQYSTWIEMTYYSTQEKVLEYARSIIREGFPPGVLILDESWEEDYGIWDFHAGRFPDPKGMIDELHNMGFKVMLFVVPFISPDRHMLLEELLEQRALLMDAGKDGLSYEDAIRPALIEWWSGYSACLDFSSSTAVDWFDRQLAYLTQTYGVDGFKFEGADMSYYTGDTLSKNSVTPNEQCRLYASRALNHSLNQIRACWKMGGQPIVQRLHDKEHSWRDLRMIIPQILAQSHCGYTFACSDMIGGGLWIDFLPGCDLDEELVVRSAQCQVLFPIMQLSLAPWRVLEEPYLTAFRDCVALRQKHIGTIRQLAAESAHTGCPIISSLEYVFPGQGLAPLNDQFMLGNALMVAPMLSRDDQRKVVLPKGQWLADDGQVFTGGQEISIEVPLHRLPHFTLQD